MSSVPNKRVITLLRHGKIAGAAGLYGRTDVPLSETGRADLQHALASIHQHTAINCIISSPLQRCATVAQEFAAQHSLPLVIEPNLQEMHFGIWDGIPFDELGDEWDNLARFWESPNTALPPEGESLQDFAQRVIDAWQRFISSIDNQEHSETGHHVIVCHGGVIRIIIAHLLKLDFCNASLFQQLHIDYASHSRIEIAPHAQAVPVIKYIGLVSQPQR